MQPPTGTQAPQQSNGLATAGLVCGILSPLLCAATAIPAVVLGHISLSKIKASGGVLPGMTASIWALILGYGSFFFIPLVAVLLGLTAPLIVRQTGKIQLRIYHTNMMTLSSCFKAYQIEKGTDTAPYPSDIHQLESMGYLEQIDRCLTVKKKHAGDWLYFSAADSEDPSSPILISPRIGTKRLMLQVDGMIKDVNEAATENFIKISPVEPTKVPAPVSP